MHSAIQSQESGASEGTFRQALHSLAQRLGAALAPKTMSMAIFKGRYSRVFKDADRGAVQVITHAGNRYVVLSERQMVHLMGPSNKPHSLADTLAPMTPPSEPLDAGLVMMAGSGHEPFSLPDRVA